MYMVGHYRHFHFYNLSNLPICTRGYFVFGQAAAEGHNFSLVDLQTLIL